MLLRDCLYQSGGTLTQSLGPNSACGRCGFVIVYMWSFHLFRGVSRRGVGGDCSKLKAAVVFGTKQNLWDQDFTGPLSVHWRRLSTLIIMRIRLPWTSRSPRGQSPPDINNSSAFTDGRLSTSDEESENVALTFEENLQNSFLVKASTLLIERERNLYGEFTPEALNSHQEEVDRLTADYKTLHTLVEEILEESMSVGLKDISIDNLRSAVKVVWQEEEQYQEWKQGKRIPPVWRDESWKAFHDKLLYQMVKKRLKTPSSPPPDMEESLQRDINQMGKQLKEDLLWVVDVVKTCYPPHMDICNVYAKMYHEAFGNRLKKISDVILVDKDIAFLLRWVNEFYPGVLQKSELVNEIDSNALGKLLSPEVLDPLEEQYLSKQQSELMTYISRVLEEAEQRWNDGEEPKREDSCFVSPLAYDIIQLINGMVTAAAKVVGDLHKAQSITCKLNDAIVRFKSLQSNIIKQNKANSKAYVKAHLGCIEQLRDVLIKKHDLFQEDEREICLRVLAEMKQSTQLYLLSPIHANLRSHYRKLGTNDWLNKSVFQNLMMDIESEIQDLQGLTRHCHQELISQFHQDVTVEYVKRLLKGEVRLKDKERQEKAYKVVKDNAESLHSFFNKMGSKEEWLKEILTKIAEVLKLQDLPAIQMQVASLGTCFPDISGKQLSALLKIKTNINKADRKKVKETLSDILKETSHHDAVHPFFFKVQVK